MQKIYLSYSEYLKQIYHEKVYKLPVCLPVSCPNRTSSGGCTFCSEAGTGFESAAIQDSPAMTVTQQLLKTREQIEKKFHAKKFIAYFQNYTNTYLPFEMFKEYLDESAGFKDLVGISISTRPDCIHETYLDYLEELSGRYHLDITIELGLQTANYSTLCKINRGHGLSEYLSAVFLIAKYPFTQCVHLIANLPWDTIEDEKETAKIISVLPVKIIKLHSLYLAKGTPMAEDYKNGKFQICSKEEYFERLAAILTHLPPDRVIERLFSRIPKEYSVFSNWGNSWWKLQDEFMDYMAEKELCQGKYYRQWHSTMLDRGGYLHGEFET